MRGSAHGEASGLNGRGCGWANVWAGTIPPHELVGGRTSDQANGQTSKSVVPRLVILPTSPLCCPNPSPCHRCLTDLSPHTVATSLLCRSTPSPPDRRRRRHRRRRRPRIAAAVAAAVALHRHLHRCHPRIATLAAATLASPPLPLSPSRRHLCRCHPRVATSAAIAPASPPPPPSPSRWRGHLAIRTSPAHSPVTPRPSSPRSHGLPAYLLVCHAFPVPPWVCADR